MIVHVMEIFHFMYMLVHDCSCHVVPFHGMLVQVVHDLFMAWRFFPCTCWLMIFHVMVVFFMS